MPRIFKTCFSFAILSAFLLFADKKVYAQCNTINNIQILESSRNGLKLQWEAVPETTEYEIAFRPKGSLGIFQTQRTLSNEVSIPLNECTTVEVKVRPLCNTIFSPTHFFTTACPPCSGVLRHSIISTRPNAVIIAAEFDFFSATAHGIKFEFRNTGEEIFENSIIRNSNSAPTLSDTFEITGLTENSSYEARLSHICIHNNVTHEVLVSSNPTAIFSFSTPAIRCQTPTGLSATPDQTSVAVRWTGNPTATSYNIDFRETGTTTFSRISSTTENVIIDNLKAGTTYEVKVQAICSGEPSAFSTLLSFTTLPPSCTRPVNLSVESITETTAVIRWAAVAAAISYTIEYREAGTNFISTTSAVNSLTLTGLNPGSAYEFRIRPDCPGIPGPFSELAGFSTLVQCVPPTGINITDITHNAARVTWIVAPGVISYDCKFHIVGDPVSTTLSSAALFVTLGGLQPSTTYEVQLQSVCQGNRSLISAPVTFTTAAAPPCIIPSGISIINLLPTSALISWTARQEAISYNIRFRQAGTVAFTPLFSFATNKRLSPLIPSTTYEVQLQTVCDGSTSDFSNLISFTTTELCDTVSGVQLLSRSHNNAVIEWQNITGAFGYTILFNPEGVVPSQDINSTINNVTLRNLLPATHYIVRIQTQCAGINSLFTREFRFTTLPVPQCSTPAGLVADEITPTSATIRWQPADGATRYKITHTIRGSNNPSINFSTVASITITGLLPATDYELQVQSICDGVDSPVSNTLFFTTLVPCQAPTNLEARNITRNSAEIQWVAATGANSYTVLFNVLGSTLTDSRVASATSATINGLLPNTMYEVKVRSACTSGSETSSAITFTTDPAIPCTPPSGLSTGSINETSAEVNWQPVSGSTSYNVRFFIAGSSSPVATRSTSSTSTLLPDLLPGTNYEFQVQTVCGQETSNFSALSPFSTFGICSIPGNLTVRSVTANSAIISWDAVPAASNYKFQFRKEGEVLFTNQNVTGTTFTIQNLIPNIRYEVQVQSICANGNSAFNTLIPFTTRTSCDFPRGLSASDITITSALISWSLWGQPGVVLKYQIEIRKSGESAFTSTSADGDSTKKMFYGLQPSTTYEVRIKSLCGSDNSDFSPLINFTTASCNTPLLPTLIASTVNTASLTWPAIPGALRYNIRFRIMGSGASGFTNRTVTNNTVTLTGLQPATNYEVAVQADCEALNSPFGQMLLFGTICPVPANVVITSLPSGEISIRFDSNPLYQSYQIRYGKAPFVTESSGSLLNFTRNPFSVSKAGLGIVSKNRYVFKLCAICINGQRSAFTSAHSIQ